MSNRNQRELRASAGDAFAKAFEMIATPAIFGLGGWYVDSLLGVFPLVTLLTVITVFGYQLWRFFDEYSAAMDDELQQRRASYATAGRTPLTLGRDPHEDFGELGDASRHGISEDLGETGSRGLRGDLGEAGNNGFHEDDRYELSDDRYELRELSDDWREPLNDRRELSEGYGHG